MIVALPGHVAYNFSTLWLNGNGYCLLLHPERDVLIKVRICSQRGANSYLSEYSPLEQILTFSSTPLFRRGLVYRKAIRKSLNLSPL